VVWPQCVKTRCQGRRVGDTGCLSAGGGEVNVCDESKAKTTVCGFRFKLELR
jgi:hypothetical protein